MEKHCHSFLDKTPLGDIIGYLSSPKLKFFRLLNHFEPDFPPNIKKWFKNNVAGFQNKTKRSYFSPMASAVMKT